MSPPPPTAAADSKPPPSKDGARPRLLFAAAAAAAAFAVGRLAGSWPHSSSSSSPSSSSSFPLPFPLSPPNNSAADRFRRLFSGAAADPRLCDPRVGCTPAQLAAKRRTPEAAGRRHAFGSVQEAWNASSVDLIDVVDRVIGRDNLGCVVNLGALDGLTDDPTYPLFRRGACGAAFEGDELVLDALERNLAPFRGQGVAVMKEFAHPSTLPARLEAAGLSPANLDVLKVDVDGFDLALARSVLEAGFRPRVVLMEANTDVPAPFTFETLYRRDYGVYFHGGFYGTSTAAIADLLEPYGYSLALADNDDSKTEHNVYLVRDDLVAAGALPDAPRDVCSVYYGGMRRYHCIHACHRAENFDEGEGEGERFDTTRAWTDELSRAARARAEGKQDEEQEPDVDAVRQRLARVWANAARRHEEVIGGEGRSDFSMGVLKYVDVKSCGAGF